MKTPQVRRKRGRFSKDLCKSRSVPWARDVFSVQLVGSVDNQVLLPREFRFVVDAIGFAHSTGRSSRRSACSSIAPQILRDPAVLPVSIVTGLEVVRLITTWPDRSTMRSRGDAVWPKSEERGALVLVLPARSCDNSNTLAE